ncbi:MAG: MraY family glycosyltransferase [bacterium]|nr:MraY family glycosyltransferase [bacterium]
MIFDTNIITPLHFILLLGVFVGMYTLLQLVIKKHPISFRVYSTGKPIYYIGWLLAILIATPAFFILHNINLAWGLIGSTIMIILIGRLDEDRKLSVKKQLFWQSSIALWAVYFGWAIPYISNPFGSGVIMLSVGGVLGFVWLLICMNAMNFLDGTDGLATGVGIIAFIVLACISILPATQDVQTLVLSFIAIGALLAFFLWNAPPARVYLGTSGSWFLGLFLGMTAMIGGGKMATAFIVLAIPVFDALFVVLYRLATKKNPTKGDRVSHIHHRLQLAGVSPWGILLLLGGITALLGVVAVIAPTNSKIIAICIFALVFLTSRALTMRRA